MVDAQINNSLFTHPDATSNISIHMDSRPLGHSSFSCCWSKDQRNILPFSSYMLTNYLSAFVYK